MNGQAAALSVGLACSRTTQYAPRARPPSALHLAIPEQAPIPHYLDTLLGIGQRERMARYRPAGLPAEMIHRSWLCDLVDV